MPYVVDHCCATGECNCAPDFCEINFGPLEWERWTKMCDVHAISSAEWTTIYCRFSKATVDRGVSIRVQRRRLRWCWTYDIRPTLEHNYSYRVQMNLNMQWVISRFKTCADEFKYPMSHFSLQNECRRVWISNESFLVSKRHFPSNRIVFSGEKLFVVLASRRRQSCTAIFPFSECSKQPEEAGRCVSEWDSWILRPIDLKESFVSNWKKLAWALKICGFTEHY